MVSICPKGNPQLSVFILFRTRCTFFSRIRTKNCVIFLRSIRVYIYIYPYIYIHEYINIFTSACCIIVHVLQEKYSSCERKIPGQFFISRNFIFDEFVYTYFCESGCIIYVQGDFFICPMGDLEYLVNYWVNFSELSLILILRS